MSRDASSGVSKEKVICSGSNVISSWSSAASLPWRLLGFAGFYLFTKIQQDQGVTAELDAATQKLETLAKRDPYPNPENIAAAKDEGKRAAELPGRRGEAFPAGALSGRAE